jgi:hypothetical protein
MTRATNPAQLYTDAPELHSNLILGALQLLCWLCFHPAAWRNHLIKIDPGLPPNFVLTELSPQQWRNPNLRRLLLQGYIVLPLLAGLLAAPILWVVAGSGESIAFGALVGAILGIGASLTSSIVIGMAAGLVVGLGVTLVGGVAVGIENSLINDLINISTVQVAVRTSVFGVLFGAISGLMGHVISSLARRKQTYALVRQMSGILVGVLFGGIILYFGRRQLSQNEINLMMGLAVGLITGLIIWWQRGLAPGLAVGLPVSLSLILVFLIKDKALFAARSDTLLAVVMFLALATVPYLLAEAVAGSRAGSIAAALGGGGGWITSFIAASRVNPWPMLALNLVSILLGLTATLWGPVLRYPFMTVWNIFLYRADGRPGHHRASWLRWHSAFWDEYQRLPLFGLEDHLLRVAKRNPTEAQAAIKYLATSRQRWAAQAAQIELEARGLESCADAEAIGQIHTSLSAGELTGPASALLRSFSRISQDVLAALYQESTYNQRLSLIAIEDRLDALLRELTRSSERYALRFLPIASRWRELVAERVRTLAAAAELRQEIESPYVIGVPLTEQQEIFVGRTETSLRIEQLLTDGRHPPLLLYGQRRIGKTSLLNNLGRLLPSTIVPLFVDLQGPTSRASDHAGFLYNLARGMNRSAQRHRALALPPLSRRETLGSDPFTGFDEWLDQVETVLGQSTALLALDEFETLEPPINEGKFSEAAILGMFRHLIQHRPRFKVLLTGSHSLDELGRWASYLINVQMIHISYLSETEARQLIEQPVRDFALRYEPEASQRVLTLTRGHPFLVQLLCAEIVTFKNEQDRATRRLARLQDVEAIVPRALRHGGFFFADIQHNRVDAAGLALLRFLAAQGEGVAASRDRLASHLKYPADLDHTLAWLTRRELIELTNKGYCFQVELIRRWFAPA